MESLRQWRESLDHFDQCDVDSQAIAVARGLRLCHSMGTLPSSGKKRPIQVEEVSVHSTPQILPGIGPALAERLWQREFETVEDLIWHLPTRYDDARSAMPLRCVVNVDHIGVRVTVVAVVTVCRFARRGRMRWVELQVCDEESQSTKLVVRWFYAHMGMTKQYPKGTKVVLSGVLRQRGNVWEMANPDIIESTIPNGKRKRSHSRIIPRYPNIIGIPGATVRKACLAAIRQFYSDIRSGVPSSVCERLQLPSLPDALLSLHDPDDAWTEEQVALLNAQSSVWHHRLAFEELFGLGLSIAQKRTHIRGERTISYPRKVAQEQRVQRGFSFVLTEAQSRAINEIATDLAKTVPMNRLLQGDVGSGKTAVAFAAATQVVAGAGQVALMAPTEILARQHHDTLASWCEQWGIRLALLTASTPKGVRASIASLLLAGQIDVLIGTHSLLSEGVGFHQLGLVIIDEQHRFGVAQRARLRNKGGGETPHLLVMTATPIPRTLALSVYGDLDVTVLDTLPPGRKPPCTRVFTGSSGRAKAYRLVAQRVAVGERAFVVCPLIEPREEDSGREGWADVTSVAKELQEKLAPAQVEVAHGRMPHEERQRRLQQLRGGDIDVLVSTTLVEVGVDVPEATVMVIEGANHFGLSQLHQLRGRVGRGGGESHCILLTSGRKTPASAKRLEAMEKSSDGFVLAEEDLQIRGPGELLGVRQAGLPRFRFGDLRTHTELLILARQEAQRILDEDPNLQKPQHQCCRDSVFARSASSVYGAEGG